MTVPRLFTIPQFVDAHPAFSVSGIRAWILASKPHRDRKGVACPSNGFDTAVVRAGRKILIDEEKFFAWLAAQQPTPETSGRIQAAQGGLSRERL